VLGLKPAEKFHKDQLVHNFTEKSGLRDVKRADFIRYWRRSELKNPERSQQHEVVGMVMRVFNTVSILRLERIHNLLLPSTVSVS